MASESALRQRAARRKLTLQKSRSRTPEVPSYGKYRLVDPYNNSVVFGHIPHDYSASKEEVEEYLAGC